MGLPETIPLIGILWEDALFLALAGGMLGFALLVVTLRDIIRAGLAMIASFGCLAGIYVLLGAPFVAAAQVIVYIGAISVLVLFAIMLTQEKVGPTRLVFQTQAVPAAIAAVILALVLAVGVTATDWGDTAGRIWTFSDELALVLFTDYILAFEVVGVLLLAAVVGAVFLAKRERGDEG